MDNDILQMSANKYDKMNGYKRDDKNKIQLTLSNKSLERKQDNLTTNIDLLEERLKQFKTEKTYIEEKKEKNNKGKKKKKKEKDDILKLIFNNADKRRSEEEKEVDEDDPDYKDIKPKKEKKPRNNTLDSTYGKRFSPSVKYLHDIISSFDTISEDIKSELKLLGKVRSKYKSDQMSNLLTSLNHKLSAVNKLTDISKVISDLEYKKEKDLANNESSNTTSNLKSLSIRYLQGDYDDKDTDKKKRKAKQKKLNKNYKTFDDDDDKPSKKDDKELANRLIRQVMDSDIEFSPHEEFIEMEGKYQIVVVANINNLEKDWRFEAVDLKGRKIKDFKKDYPKLIPKKANTKLIFDTSKMKATDKLKRITYKLILVGNN